MEPNTELRRDGHRKHDEGDELAVNPTKGKQLTNVRMGGQADEKNRSGSASENDAGRGLEIVAEDEYLEVHAR